MSFIFKTKPFQFSFQRQSRHKFSYIRFFSKNHINDSYGTFLTYIKHKQVERAVYLFQKMKLELFNEKRKLPADSYSSLSHLFHKAEHLKFAEELFDELIKDHSQPNEQTYLALIRCCCDAGDIGRARILLNDVLKLPVEPRLRTYHPLIECLCLKKTNPSAVIDLFKEMLSKGIKPSSDQLTLFLQTSFQESSFKNTSFLEEVNTIVDEIGFDLLGLNPTESIQLNAAFMNSTVHDVLDQVSK